MGTEKSRIEKINFVQNRIEWLINDFCVKFKAQKRTAKECLKIVVLGHSK